MWALSLLFAIAGGELAGACQYPSVVSFRGFDTKCTGTLVHPEVVLTAAHCLEGATGIRVRFGEEFSPRERIIDSAACWMHPDYTTTRTAADDIGVCTLVEAVTDVPITPIAIGCELDALEAGTEVTLVGFGVTPTVDYGSKRVAVTTIASGIEDDGSLRIGTADVGGCLGDSGGPALMRYPDGVWRVIGLLSTSPDCGTGPGRFATLRDHIAWAQSVVERDLTPCHDDAGTFVGGPECRAFEADPVDIADAWLDGCRGELADPSQTCVEEASSSSSSSSGDEGEPAASSAGCTCSFGHPLLGACFISLRRRRR